MTKKLKRLVSTLETARKKVEKETGLPTRAQLNIDQRCGPRVDITTWQNNEILHYAFACETVKKCLQEIRRQY